MASVFHSGGGSLHFSTLHLSLKLCTRANAVNGVFAKNGSCTLVSYGIGQRAAELVSGGHSKGKK